MLARGQNLLLRLSLHRRILVFVSGILLAVFIAFGYVGWTAVDHSVADKLDERRATANAVARHLDDLISHARSHVLVAAADVAAGPDLAPERVAQVLQLSLHQTGYFFTHMLVFDPGARVLAIVPEAATVNVDEEVRSMLAKAVSSGVPAISNLVRLPVEGSYGVLFVAPVVRGEQVLGVLVAEMPVPHPAISSVALSLRIGKTGHMEVIDEKGWVLASTFNDDIIDQTEHPEFYLPLARAKQNAVGSAWHYERNYAPSRADEDPWHVMAFVSLANASWGVGLGQTESETFATTNDLRNRAIAVALIALVVALCCAWLGTQSVVGPIRTLTKAGERMATGDLSQPIRVVQADEVGRLGEVLESMRTRLDQSLGEIKAWNRELEQRVRGRTKELEVSNRHLQALMAVANVASRRVDTRELLAKALQELIDTLDARAAWVFLWDENEQRLKLVSDLRLPEGVRTALATIDNPGAACFASLQATTILNAPDMPCPILHDHFESAMPGVGCWCVSIRVGAAPLGALCLAVPLERKLSSDESDLVHGIARQVAVAFENARLSEEKVRLEAQKHLALLRAELLATVSHELRTPLGFIKGYATTLLREDVLWDAPQQREFLQVIDEECDRLAELVESLLDAARSQAGRLTMQAQPVSLDQVLQHSVERMAGVLQNHRVVVELDASPVVLGDESRLEQVMVNLLQNAVKYSPKGGTIEVQLQVVGDEARVAVLDEGVGVPEAEAWKIFEPFYRASTDTNSHVGGAGLGLAVSKAIIEGHKGQIWAEPRPQRGTAMRFAIPCSVADQGVKANGQEVRTRG